MTVVDERSCLTPVLLYSSLDKSSYFTVLAAPSAAHRALFTLQQSSHQALIGVSPADPLQ